MKNLYMVLGVDPKSADILKEIRTKYRELAQIHHPDKGGDPKEFDVIRHAYDILSNPAKRREYDKKVSSKPITKLSETVHEIVDEFWVNLQPK